MAGGIPDGELKMPAARTPTKPSRKRRKSAGDDDLKMPAVSNSSKKSSGDSSPQSSEDEVVDLIASSLNFGVNDKLEVKWIISDDDETEQASNKVHKVWWRASLNGKVDKFHHLSDKEQEESGILTSNVKVAIYELSYEPRPDLGYDTNSIEEVAFLSDHTLLNLSTEEIMLFRKEGAPSPPGSPVPEDEVVMPMGDEPAARKPVKSEIARTFNGEDEMKSFLDEVMNRVLKSSGIDAKLREMPMSSQQDLMWKIRTAKDRMLDKLLEELGNMKSGEKVITEDVVNRCLSDIRL
mmetsp:Transcript_30395/g.68538  ORF Transcript_30395/g.68538 Transcript_30395/m.68538 type:complete len:294 (-) Transcript_30395:83-964(-)